MLYIIKQMRSLEDTIDSTVDKQLKSEDKSLSSTILK